MTTKRGYYVTALLNGGTANQRTAWLAGPFDTHRAAIAMVPAVRYLAQLTDDPRMAFAAFGTAKRTGETLPAGRLDIAALIDDAYVGRVIDPWRKLNRD